MFKYDYLKGKWWLSENDYGSNIRTGSHRGSGATLVQINAMRKPLLKSDRGYFTIRPI